MLKKEDKQTNFFDEYVYGHLIPHDHILVKIKQHIDFSFVEAETKDLYSPDQGRPAYPAGLLFRIFFLEFYYNLSDVEVVKQCRYNILFRWFVGLTVEGRVPDDTSLVVFRKRLGAARFERFFNRIVGLARERGLLKERYKIIDATSIVADVAIPNTVNLLRQGRRVIIKEIVQVDRGAAERLRPHYESREKLAQKPTSVELVEEVDKSESFVKNVKGKYGAAVDEKIGYLERVLHPDAVGEKVVSFIDFDARHGRKSVKRMFSGYKAHIAEDENEIVTSCEVFSGNRNEGHELPTLLVEEQTKGLKAEAVVADSLYDSGQNRELIHRYGMRAYIPFRRERKWVDQFQYIAKEDCVRCAMGKCSIGKCRQESGTLYYFSERDCGVCSQFKKCVRQNQGRMTIWVSDSYKQKIIDDGAGRCEALSLRKMIERKFGEAKKWHKMDRARYRGRWRVTIQVLMTFLVINVKRIARLIEHKALVNSISRICPAPT